MPGAPDAHGGALVELGAGVHAWVAARPSHAHPNAGVVVDDDGTTVIDSLTTPSQWIPFGRAISDLGLLVRRVVLTSSHIAQVGGAAQFLTAGRYGRAETSAHLEQPPNLEGYRRLYPDLADEFDDRIVTKPITHVVAEPAWLSMRVLALPVRGHQDENLVIQVPDANVVFAGALCTFGVTPNAFDGDPEAWADQLADVAEWGTTIVPGVGPVGGPADVIALQAYLYACVEAEGDSGAIPPGPWDDWADRDLDAVNVERAAMLARGDRGVPPSMRARLGLP
jgi:glyoxylase-like metal-dependent hydrolase (beta-lactamase superfamily II)